MYKNFIDDCLSGEAFLEDIEDYVEYWHNNDLKIELDEFIGLTEYESEKWLQEGNGILRGVIYCRRHNISFEKYEGMSTETKIAARSYKLKDIQDIKNDK